jgi:hypothetical protein
MSVFFLFELTDDNKTRQWDGLFIERKNQSHG